MKCLLVLAHPLANSLNATLAQAAAAALRDAGHEVKVRNLYETGFSPALTTAERQGYYTGFDSSRIAAEAEELQEAETLVLVFPTWWFSLPAMLKGWIDRVWAPGVAYDHATDLGALKPRLQGLKHTIAITTLGSPWWVDRFVMRQPVKRVLKWGVVRACAPKSSFRFLSFYTCEKKTPQQVEDMVAKVRAAVRSATGSTRFGGQ